MPGHTIAENLARLTAAKAAIANAITIKGGMVTQGDGFEAFSADIATIPQDGDVVFFDYDGTVIKSYRKEEFLMLSTLPANPSHEGLTAQGWNWTLAKAKAHVMKYGKLNIGQMYITSDGKTRIKIKLEEGRLEPVLGLGINGTVAIDWGDGTNGTMTGNNTQTLVQLQHVYASSGEYTIALDVTGSISFQGDDTYGSKLMMKVGVTSETRFESQPYQNAIREIYIGNGITSIKGYAFYSCDLLTFVTIPNGITFINGYAFYSCNLTSVTIPNSMANIGGDSIFSGCNSLTSVTIPDSATSISSSVFNGCSSLTSVTIPDGVTSIGDSAFSGCRALNHVTIPDSVTYIGVRAFDSCYSLTTVTIPNGVVAINNYAFDSCYLLTSVTIPDSVTSIGEKAFQNCNALTSVTIPYGVTSIGEYAFNSCRALTSVTIPDSVTSIDRYAFSGCYSLTSVTIPDSIASINSYTFSSCSSLISVTIPDSVTSINSWSFNSCNSLISVTIPDSVTYIGTVAFGSYSLAFIKFEGSTPPTLQDKWAFMNLPTDCIIYVPSGSLTTYKSASYYPDPSVYTYVGY